MAIILNDIVLPDDLDWVDQYWVARIETGKYTLSGAYVVFSATRQAGRPITLRGGEDYAWIDESTFDALIALAELGQNMTLQIDDQVFTVRFRYDDEPIYASRIGPGPWMNNVLLKFVTVEV
ncbi:hypothetical protein [Thermodesulforhabdus norvegica]|uniref:Uncharacterized protein n=1 Tax=Thermodesulforhabdus norvegica TaxID=39841 RepID=A0A1I4SV26_9BACT|nr:hypothetical protein [Thermodesulforhabdus norvegica]SFM68346.1 hypothetical protein SAMN05660836_01183 [Thermodesulforhabdus norvegica]